MALVSQLNYLWKQLINTRWLWRITRLLLITYCLILLLAYLAQTWLIFPGSFTQGKAEAVVYPLPTTSLLHLTLPDGKKIVAIFGHALDAKNQLLADAAQRPTLLYFYGNGMCLNDALVDFQAFRRLGINVMVPEYPGYGMSEGNASETGCYASADLAYQYLLTEAPIDHNKIFVAGWSLGAAVAIDLAARKPVKGLAIFSAFSSMPAMAWRMYPFLPSSLILRHRFENISKMASIKCPIFIGHSKLDSFIPFTMSEQLAMTAKGSVTAIYLNAGEHNEFFFAAGEKIFQPLREFLDVGVNKPH